MSVVFWLFLLFFVIKVGLVMILTEIGSFMIVSIGIYNKKLVSIGEAPFIAKLVIRLISF